MGVSRFWVFEVQGFGFLGLQGRGFGFVVSLLGLRVWLSRFPLRVLGVSRSGFLKFGVSVSGFRRFGVSCSGFRGFRSRGYRFGVLGSGFFEVSRFGISRLPVRVFEVQGFGFRVLGFEVRGFGFGISRFRLLEVWGF